MTGRIGSGKTTLLEAALGLLPLDSGEVRWNGAPIDDARVFLVPPRCAYTPETPWLSSDTVRNNILMGLQTDEEDPAAAVGLGVMEQDVAELESGIETVVGPRGVKLCRADRCSVRRRRGCSCATRSCWSSTTCPAHCM